MVGFIDAHRDAYAVEPICAVLPIAQRPGEVTEDYRHVMGCVREVLGLPDIRVDREPLLIAGFSVGGSVAPYIATHDDPFTAFGVLHGHVVLEGPEAISLVTGRQPACTRRGASP